MIIKLLTLFLVSSAYCQYMVQNSMRADMTFDDDNDRFRAPPMMEQKPHYYEEEEDYRRLRFPNMRSKRKHLTNMESSLRRIGNDDFATHDNMVSGPEDGTLTDYERTLNRIRNGEYRRKLQSIVDELHGVPKGGRRSDVASNPEKEILLHYAVPIDMKVQGYMQMPSV